MTVKLANKDPNEVLDYQIDWVGTEANPGPMFFDDSDVIVDSTWEMPSGDLMKDSDEFDDTSTTIWLSGGSEGVTYSMVNRIETQGGRTHDQTVKIKIKTK